MGSYYGCNNHVMAILYRLAPGSTVSVWFDNSGFLTTYFQFFNDHQVAFSGGSLGSGLTYVNISEIVAVKVGA